MFLLFNNLIPLDLVVVMELGKLFVTMLIDVDLQLYSEEQEGFIECFNFRIHEDLGCVKYILTDKTGTLTTNELTFKGVSVGNKRYFDPDNDEYHNPVVQ